MNSLESFFDKFYKIMPKLSFLTVIIIILYTPLIPFIFPNDRRELIKPYTFYGNIDVTFEDGSTYQTKIPHTIITNQSFDVTLHLENIGMIDDKTLSFISKDTTLRCEVDDDIIFKNSIIHSHSNFDDGNILYLIELPEKIKDNKIILHYEYTDNSTAYFDLSHITIGKRINILAYYFLKGNYLNSMIVLFMILLVSSMFLTGTTFNAKTPITVYFNHIAILCLGLIFYIIALSPISYFIFHKFKVFLHIISYTCIMLIPISISRSILAKIDKFPKIYFKISIVLASLNIIVQYLLIIFKIGTLSIYAKYSYIIVLYTCLISLIAFINNIHTQDKSVKIMILSLTPLIISVIVDSIISFLSRRVIMSIFFKLGLLVFVILQTYDFIKVYINKRDQEIESNLYKKLAYIDKLTALGNRHSFSEKKELLSKEGSLFYVIALDIDNLKYINDTYGHKYGDAIISRLADMIKEIFTDNYDAFRIGGDEFIIFYHVNEDDELPDKLKKLAYSYSTSFIDNNICEYGVSYGYSYYDRNLINLDEALHIADKNMYINKSNNKSR